MPLSFLDLDKLGGSGEPTTVSYDTIIEVSGLPNYALQKFPEMWTLAWR